jgi:hypothetical protein
MLDGYRRELYPKLGGLVTSMPPTHIPFGSAAVAEDVEFTPKTVKTRRGLSQAFQINNNPSINGLDNWVQQAGQSTSQQTLIAFDSNSIIYKEPFPGAGVMQSIGSVANDATYYMLLTSAYDKAFMAFSNLITSGTPKPLQYLLYQNQFFLDPVSIAPPTIAQVQGMTYRLQNLGDVPVGIFYATVLFITRSGYITGQNPDAFLPIQVNTANSQLVLSNIPIGGSNVVGRIIAFTIPGASSLGNYFYIPASYSIAGLNSNITSTQINDNTTTSISLNFTSLAVLSGLDVTQYQDKIQVPAVVGCKFVKGLRRMCYWGNQAEPSTVFVSEPDDPETLFGSKSRVIAAQNDGQRVNVVFEWRSEVYVGKERGGYVLTPNNTYPTTWDVTLRWEAVGPCGPRALDTCEEFVVFVHRSGAYRYEGGAPEWISWEHSGDEGLWARINWTVQQLISVKIDTETKRIYFCVPLDQSTVPNKILVLDYRAGFGSPIIQDYAANLISNDGRKWSLWNIPANQVVRTERVVPNVPGTTIGA